MRLERFAGFWESFGVEAKTNGGKIFSASRATPTHNLRHSRESHHMRNELDRRRLAYFLTGHLSRLKQALHPLPHTIEVAAGNSLSTFAPSTTAMINLALGLYYDTQPRHQF